MDPEEADNFHYLSQDDLEWGVAGIAFRGTICYNAKKYRTAISEVVGRKSWSSVKMTTARVRSHFACIMINSTLPAA